MGRASIKFVFWGAFRYEEEHARPHWPEHYRRDVERDRHSASSREHEPEREDERKYRRRREIDRAKCCCPDRDLEFQGGLLVLWLLFVFGLVRLVS